MKGEIVPEICGRVLIPSDVQNWVVNLAEAYRNLGFDVVVGKQNFELECCSADIVHLQWPEEMTGWKVPSLQDIARLTECLDRWAKRSRIISTVHNLYPHGHYRNPDYHRLFTTFYERSDVIHHFGETSRTLVCQEYPVVAGRCHVVRLGFNYDRLIPASRPDRSMIRQALGLQPDEVVYLVFGSLRSRDELRLIQEAYSRARVKRKRLLMAARYHATGPVWRQRLGRWRWQFWQQHHSVVEMTEYVPDEQVFRLFHASDAVVIVRQNSMGSGIPSLTMTFGRMAIAPDSGMIPEYLAGADNILYQSDSSASLADAMERAAAVDREAIGARNRQIAAGWDWQSIIRTCLDALPAAPARSRSAALVASTG
jgi:glycosyltransferase involved in cell wall biosynthesis